MSNEVKAISSGRLLPHILDFYSDLEKGKTETNRDRVGPNYQLLRSTTVKREPLAVYRALDHAAARPGDCVHGRETKAISPGEWTAYRNELEAGNDPTHPRHCSCPDADYVSAPRWLLIAARELSWSVIKDPPKRTAKGRGGQHSRFLRRFENHSRDLHTYSMVCALERFGTTLEEAFAAAGKSRKATIRNAYKRVLKDFDKYLPTVTHEDLLGRRSKSHFEEAGIRGTPRELANRIIAQRRPRTSKLKA